ncbi:unnamed protein product [Orchesella dallaii]|uniref:Odorant receptor n=1 Tax=Orchesella dallaii TaxID=48710 RepID=A0ABP1S8P0_9HEXA
MLRDAKLLEWLIAAGQSSNFLTGKNYTAILPYKDKIPSNNKDTDSLSLETTMGICIVSAFFLFLHYFYLMLIAGKEVETFFNSANKYEIVNFIDIRKYLQSASGKRFLILVRLMDLGFRRISTSVGPQFMAISAVLLPSSPMNFLGLFPEKSCSDLILKIIGINKMAQLLEYLLVALQFLGQSRAATLLLKQITLPRLHLNSLVLQENKYSHRIPITNLIEKMLHDAKLLKWLIAAGQSAKSFTGKNYTGDGNWLRVNRKTFKKHFCACFLLLCIQLLNLINTRFHSNNKDTGSLNVETTMEICVVSAFFLFLHYYYLMLVAGKELETFFHAASTYEMVNFLDIREYLQSASGKRFLVLVRLMDLGFRRLSTSVGPQFMAISAVLLPSSPMNLFALFPGKSCIDLMLKVIGFNKMPQLLGYLLMALQYLGNWIIWVLIFKFGLLTFYHTGICALILSKYLLILKR